MDFHTLLCFANSENKIFFPKTLVILVNYIDFYGEYTPIIKVFIYLVQWVHSKPEFDFHEKKWQNEDSSQRCVVCGICHTFDCNVAHLKNYSIQTFIVDDKVTFLKSHAAHKLRCRIHKVTQIICKSQLESLFVSIWKEIY